MINDNPNESSAPVHDEVSDLDAVLNFESKEYAQLANILNKNVSNKKPEAQEEKKAEPQNAKVPE